MTGVVSGDVSQVGSITQPNANLPPSSPKLELRTI